MAISHIALLSFAGQLHVRSCAVGISNLTIGLPRLIIIEIKFFDLVLLIKTFDKRARQNLMIFYEFSEMFEPGDLLRRQFVTSHNQEQASYYYIVIIIATTQIMAVKFLIIKGLIRNLYSD